MIRDSCNARRQARCVVIGCFVIFIVRYTDPQEIDEHDRDSDHDLDLDLDYDYDDENTDYDDGGGVAWTVHESRSTNHESFLITIDIFFILNIHYFKYIAFFEH